jgi:hypothetical protein
MKKLMSLYLKVCIVFMTVFVTPAVMASVISLDLGTYVRWITSPLYCSVMFITSFLFTAVFIDHIVTTKKGE